MTNQSYDPVSSLGTALERRIIETLNAEQIPEFEPLLDLKNLAGDSTGHVRTFTADRLFKGTSVSIDMMPGARYFNIHLIPEPGLDVPRFLFEGMAMTRGSQISLDLFPDYDVITQFDRYQQTFAKAADIYEEARVDDRFVLEPSRLFHMRAFSSPLFMLVFKADAGAAAALETCADRYFDFWLDLYREARELPADEADERAAMRRRIAATIRRMDPDRDMVVKVYGEETTRLIEAANLS